MLKKVIWIVTALFIVFYNTHTYAEPKDIERKTDSVYSLDDLFKLALKHAETIKISEENLYIKKRVKDRAFSVLIPKVTAFSGYSYSQDDTSNTYGENTIIPDYDSSNTKTTLNWGLKFEQSFTLNGKELIYLDITSEDIEKGKLDLKKVKENYFFEVATTYFNILKAKKVLEINQANVKKLEEHKRSIKTKLELEELTKLDLYRVEADLSGAKADLIKVINSLKYSRAFLLNIVELPENFDLSEPDNTNSKKSNSYTLETLKQESLVDRADIKAAEKNKNKTEYTVKYKKSAYWPTLSIYGTYTNTTVESTYTDEAYLYDDSEVDTNTNNYTLGIDLSCTIFDNGLRSAKVKQAQAEKRIAEYNLRIKKKKVLLEIEQAYLDLITQEGLLEALSDKLTSSKENYKETSLHFKYGLKNSIDLMDANTLLVSSERELAEAEFNYRLALIKIDYVKGSFLESVGYK